MGHVWDTARLAVAQCEPTISAHRDADPCLEIERKRPRFAIADSCCRLFDKLRHHQVYNDAMGRTQIYLGEDELELLDRASRETGASRSELVRRAVRATFGRQGKDERLGALRASAGSWRGRRGSGAQYVNAIRSGDLNERLARLGVK